MARDRPQSQPMGIFLLHATNPPYHSEHCGEKSKWLIAYKKHEVSTYEEENIYLVKGKKYKL
jgi:hypothetical protein